MSRTREMVADDLLDCRERVARLEAERAQAFDAGYAAAVAAIESELTVQNAQAAWEESADHWCHAVNIEKALEAAAKTVREAGS